MTASDVTNYKSNHIISCQGGLGHYVCDIRKNLSQSHVRAFPFEPHLRTCSSHLVRLVSR